MTMMDCILEQPGIFWGMLKQSVEITERFREIFVKERPDHIYLIASGTSCNGAGAAAVFMEDVLQVEVSVCPPSRIGRIFGERPLLIFISQGGKSTNMIGAVERLRGYTQIAMTGNADGTINGMCGNYMEIPCGVESVGPKTKGYTATVLMLYLMALEGAKAAGTLTEQQFEGYMDTLRTTGRNYEENIARCGKWMERNEAGLMALKEVYLVGKGQSLFIAQEGALKMMETYLIPGVAFDFEEFLHGPACSLRESTGGIYLVPDCGDKDCGRMQRIVDYHRNICHYVYTIGLADSGDERDCTLLSSGKWYTKPFEEMLPMQMISAVIPGMRGIDGVGMERFKALDQIMGIKDKGRG